MRLRIRASRGRTSIISRAPGNEKKIDRPRIIALIVLVGLMSGIVYWRLQNRTYHLATVQPGVLYRDGSRSVKELAAAVERVKARMVVSLIDDEELHDPNKPQFTAEPEYLLDHGVKYQRIPVKLGGWPRSQDLREFLHAVNEPTNRPVLLHCAQGVRRTAMFVAAYQESVLGYDKVKAKNAIISFGHSDRTVGDIERFIDNYDPQSKTVKDLDQKP